MTHGGEDAFDGVGRAQVDPMLGGEVEEGQQGLAVFGQAFDRLVVLAVFQREAVDGFLGRRGRAPYISRSPCFMPGCADLAALFNTFALL